MSTIEQDVVGEDADVRVSVQSSRFWALVTFKLTLLIFPDRLSATDRSIHAVKTHFFLTPWVRDESHMQLSHIAEVGHDRGLIWDALTIESTGGMSPITVRGLPKGRASAFVTFVRERLNIIHAARG